MKRSIPALVLAYIAYLPFFLLLLFFDYVLIFGRANEHYPYPLSYHLFTVLLITGCLCSSAFIIYKTLALARSKPIILHFAGPVFMCTLVFFLLVFGLAAWTFVTTVFYG